jgi:hypothetical protein
MNRTRLLQSKLSQALLVAVIGSVAIVGCKKKEEAAPAPAPTIAEPAAPPPPPPAPTATASVASVDLGNAVGPDMKLTAMSTTFKPKDTITVSIGTTTSDPAATVAGKIGAKWTYLNGTEVMVVSEETKDLNLTGTGATNFQIAKPDGFPVGKYKVEVSLDGMVVQTKDFEVTK